MLTLIIIQLILAILLVILVLLQGSDNEGLGLGGGGGGLGGMMSARGSANLLSRLTALTATLFMVMSVVLTIFASVGSERNVLESLPSISSEEQNAEEPVIPENN
jgi:preprotein translocase subunit SecG